MEKVNRLAALLSELADHRVLRGSLDLHGGTALNLFILEPRRLSLDLDLNYIASPDRGKMLSDRDAVISSVSEVGRVCGYRVSAPKGGHAGCTMKLGYDSTVSDKPEFLKVDLNFMNRAPIAPPEVLTAKPTAPPVEFLIASHSRHRHRCKPALVFPNFFTPPPQ